MMAFAWPGNVRQLENTCRWLTVMTPGQLISIEDLPNEITEQAELSESNQDTDWQQQFQIWFEAELKQGKHNIWPDIQNKIESQIIKSALKHSNGHKQDAAHLIGWGRNTLTRKLKELNIER